MTSTETGVSDQTDMPSTIRRRRGFASERKKCPTSVRKSGTSSPDLPCSRNAYCSPYLWFPIIAPGQGTRSAPCRIQNKKPARRIAACECPTTDDTCRAPTLRLPPRRLNSSAAGFSSSTTTKQAAPFWKTSFFIPSPSFMPRTAWTA